MIYARIKNGRIVEFPLSSDSALSPLDGYVAVIVPSEPTISKNERFILKCTLSAGKPVAQYIVTKKTILSILSENRFNSYIDSKNVDRKFTSYPLTEQKNIITKIDSVTNDILDLFASERHYDSIQSCLSYASSSIMDYRKDAQHASDVRDITWSSVIEFKNKLKKDEVPVPVSMTELKSCFENVQWD